MIRRVSYDEFRKNLTNYMDEVSAGPLFIESASARS